MARGREEEKQKIIGKKRRRKAPNAISCELRKGQGRLWAVISLLPLIKLRRAHGHQWLLQTKRYLIKACKKKRKDECFRDKFLSPSQA